MVEMTHKLRSGRVKQPNKFENEHVESFHEIGTFYFRKRLTKLIQIIYRIFKLWYEIKLIKLLLLLFKYSR